MKEQSCNKTIKLFFEHLTSRITSKEILQITSEPSNTGIDKFSIIPNIEDAHKICVYETPIPLQKEYQLIIGDLPIGAKVGTTDASGESVVRNLGWLAIGHTSKHLSENGIGLYLIEPNGFYGTQGQKFIDYLKTSNIYVNGYIRLPRRIYAKHSSIDPILAIVQKKQQNFQIFDITQQDYMKIVVEKINSGQFNKNNLAISIDTFRGFKAIDIQKQITLIDTRYKDFSTRKLKQLVLEVNDSKDGQNFEEFNNCIYLKKIGNNKPLLINTNEISGRMDNFIQIKLNDNISNEFLKIFFSSPLGELILDNATNANVIPRLDKNILLSTEIPLPTHSIQEQIIETDKRLVLLTQEINSLQNQIAINPQSSNVASKIDKMLEITSSLTEGQKIKSLIMAGESKILEFKQTFEYCIKRKTREKDIELSALKTIVGFLNSEGGVLLIGVHDNGIVLGIDYEMGKFHKNSHDKLILHIKNKIKTRLGVFALNFIEMTIIEVDDSCVFKIKCLPSNEEIFLDNKEFYIRTSPSTDKLEGRDLSTYVKNRFG